jgi:hypothetical protein
MMRWLWAAVVASAALLLLGLAQAVQDPVVVHYRLAVVGLAQPVRILQLSDLHYSPIDMPTARVVRIVAQANRLRPDLVVITGDFAGGKLIDWPGSRLQHGTDPLGGLRAPLGVFAAAGDHDDPCWTRWAMQRARIRLLAGEGQDIGPFTLVGAEDLILGQAPKAGLARAVALAPAGKPVIVIGHQPAFWQGLSPRADLLIAGDTHGGQISLLGAAPLADFNRRHRRGLFRRGHQQMVVSSGLGTSGVPIRLGVPPEIVVISLVPAHSVGRNSGTER